jgi:hypothetical protein
MSGYFCLDLSFILLLAKGRTNYELHPEIYALRDGVAQTMTLFKPRLVTVHRPTCLFHQQQSPVTTPIRVKFIFLLIDLLLSRSFQVFKR